jgi:hypothetical protein
VDACDYKEHNASFFSVEVRKIGHIGKLQGKWSLRSKGGEERTDTTPDQ